MSPRDLLLALIVVIAWGVNFVVVKVCLQGGHAMSLAGFVLTLCAAGMWALGNIVTKKVGKVDLVGLVVWGSLIPPLPFFAASFVFEGPREIAAALSGISAAAIFAIAYLAFIATLIGYGLWSRLLSRYPASRVAQRLMPAR